MNNKEILVLGVVVTAFIGAVYYFAGLFTKNNKNNPSSEVDLKTIQDNPPRYSEQVFKKDIDFVEPIEVQNILPTRPTPTTLLTDCYWVME